MLRIVTPAMREILTPEEFAATTTRVLRGPARHSMRTIDDWPAAGPEDELDETTLLEYRTHQDWGGSWMQGHETPTEMYDRFRSELQDYVAESTFGWGQWRP